MKNLILYFLIFSPYFIFSQSDDCATATIIGDSITCQSTAYTLSGLGWSGNQTSACFSGSYWDPIDGWFTFIATSDSTTIEATTNGNNVFYLAVFSGICTSLTELSCYEPPATNGPVDLTITTTPGDQYWIQLVNNTGNSTGNICVYETEVANVDCSLATPICGNSSFNGNSSGDGVEEILSTGYEGCLATGERQSSWYTFTILTGGTLDFSIIPSNGIDDYDFALWGPNGTCPPTSVPLRCSYAAFDPSGGGNPNTGLLAGAGDNTETDNPTITPHWVESINVIAGETYILLINNFSSTTSPFSLNWGGTAVLDCSVLPIELSNFTVRNENNVNRISWSTLSEINNSHFELERSVDAINWILVKNITGSGNSNQQNNYTFKDHNYKQGINYYRLKQIDFDGKVSTFKIIAINNALSNSKTLISITNLLGKAVTEEEPGIKFYRYSDGSVVKKIDL